MRRWLVSLALLVSLRVLAAVLRVAHAYEQATPWHQRRPPI